MKKNINILIDKHNKVIIDIKDKIQTQKEYIKLLFEDERPIIPDTKQEYDLNIEKNKVIRSN